MSVPLLANGHVVDTNALWESEVSSQKLTNIFPAFPGGFTLLRFRPY